MKDTPLVLAINSRTERYVLYTSGHGMSLRLRAHVVLSVVSYPAGPSPLLGCVILFNRGGGRKISDSRPKNSNKTTCKQPNALPLDKAATLEGKRRDNRRFDSDNRKPNRIVGVGGDRTRPLSLRPVHLHEDVPAHRLPLHLVGKRDTDDAASKS